MKKPRDLDADLEALLRRAKALKGRRVSQLGELVIATGAVQLDVEALAGALLAAASADATTRAAWRRAGAAFFRDEARAAEPDARRGGGAAPGERGGASG